jgi:hypothetical protein
LSWSSVSESERASAASSTPHNTFECTRPCGWAVLRSLAPVCHCGEWRLSIIDNTPSAPWPSDRQEPTYTMPPPATSSWAAKTRSGSRPPPAPLCKADTHLKRVARIADYAFKAAALREPQGEGPGSGDACGDGRSSRGVVAPVRDGAGRREFGPRGSPMADAFRL